ncbi:hypothetical protein [Salipaludibacillus aurantiacus]|uniref:Uncharacterized protein n=1 Tax=Salipaludibacillus aurantiacus TaxID=1601833 RepID=A0A1H9UG17_9BACI|nr:hypothetical protein [Salipaludibacillus aurantiacus]SES08114.1 hypothetical protein SAMN05518684_107179 [Salipaludibacillus aurantiacus]
MKLFQMKSKPHGKERLEEFLEKGYVAIGWPGIGDLSGVSKQELKERLEKKYGYQGQQLGTYLGAVNAFVNTMDKNDLVLISDGEYAHLGIVGSYEYEKDYDNDEYGICHQREVKWTATINKDELPENVTELLRNRGTITQFKHPVESAGLDRYLTSKETLSVETLEKALSIVEKELNSKDLDRRFNAAVELLRFVK